MAQLHTRLPFAAALCITSVTRGIIRWAWNHYFIMYLLICSFILLYCFHSRKLATYFQVKSDMTLPIILSLFLSVSVNRTRALCITSVTRGIIR